MKTKKQQKKIKKKALSKQEITLIGTFAFLMILVVVLLIVALNMKNIAKNEKTNITIPVLEENSQNEISVYLSDMQIGNSKEYVFKVTNYKDNSINTKNIIYHINITSSETVKLKLYKNNSKTNILKEESSIVENNKLISNRKKEDIYRLVIEAKETPKKEDKITIKINS